MPKHKAVRGLSWAGKAWISKGVYAPLGVPIGGGVHPSIFPRFFKKRSQYGRAREVKAGIAQL